MNADLVHLPEEPVPLPPEEAGAGLLLAAPEEELSVFEPPDDSLPAELFPEFPSDLLSDLLSPVCALSALPSDELSASAEGAAFLPDLA